MTRLWLPCCRDWKGHQLLRVVDRKQLVQLVVQLFLREAPSHL